MARRRHGIPRSSPSFARPGDVPRPRLRSAWLAAVGLAAGLFAAPTTGHADEAASASPYRWEGGARYWYSTGSSTGTLYNSSGSVLVSRLAYEGLDAHAGELYFLGEHEPTGLFAKGLLGAGVIGDGAFIDEDFPPVTSPYSNTLSATDGDDLRYASIDLGYHFQRTPDYDLGAFVGYSYYHEMLAASGCTQRASSSICDPTIAAGVPVIEQENDWHSLRLGLRGALRAGERWTLTADAAFLYSYLDGEDRHLLRPAINPLPEDGHGPGAQLELVLDYRATDRLSLGVGARYWRFGSDGYAYFNRTPGGGSAQVMEWSTERYGAFLQATYAFN